MLTLVSNNGNCKSLVSVELKAGGQMFRNICMEFEMSANILVKLILAQLRDQGLACYGMNYKKRNNIIDVFM